MPKGTKVHNLVDKLKREGRVDNPYAVAQAATGQSYATGKPIRDHRNPTRSIHAGK